MLASGESYHSLTPIPVQAQYFRSDGPDHSTESDEFNGVLIALVFDISLSTYRQSSSFSLPLTLPLKLSSSQAFFNINFRIRCTYATLHNSSRSTYVTGTQAHNLTSLTQLALITATSQE
jgi:hypothetical protein